MIRLGKPENSILNNLTEKRSIQETYHQKDLENEIMILKNAKSLLNDWNNHANSYDDNLTSPLIQALLFASNYLKLKDGIDEFYSPDKEPESKVRLLSSKKQLKLLSAILKDVNDTNSVKSFSISEFENLVESSEHWHLPSNNPDLSRQYLVLYKWLSFESPPARCKAFNLRNGTEQRCLQSCKEDKQYCVLIHKCKLTNCESLRIKDSSYCAKHSCTKCDNIALLVNGSHLCENCVCCLCLEKEVYPGSSCCKVHKCFIENCLLSSLQPFGFCHQHTCIKCLESHKISIDSHKIVSIENGYSNFCINHKCKQNNCLEARLNDSNFCHLHSCRFCSSVSHRSSLCIDHLCQYPEEECDNSVIMLEDGRNSIFCEIHTCYCCINLGNENLDRIVYPPNFTCMEHIICQGISSNGENCKELVNAQGIYCDEHATIALDLQNNSECCGLTKKGKKCRTKRPDSIEVNIWYCVAHIDQFKDSTKTTKKMQNSVKLRQIERGVNLDILSNSINLEAVQSFCFQKCQSENCFVYMAENESNSLCLLHRSLNSREEFLLSLDNDDKKFVQVYIDHQNISINDEKVQEKSN